MRLESGITFRKIRAGFYCHNLNNHVVLNYWLYKI